MTKSHDQYRRIWIDGDRRFGFGRFLHNLAHAIEIGQDGYRFSKASRSTMAIAFRVIFNELETERIEFDPRERQLLAGMRFRGNLRVVGASHFR